MRLWMITILIAILFITACETQEYYSRTSAPSVDDTPVYNNNEQVPEETVAVNITKSFPLPLVDISKEDTYKGENGGLYGWGMNIPPESLREEVFDTESRIQPVDKNGNPTPDGKIGFVSIGMRNAEMEFGVFKIEAESDPEINPDIVFVNGAQEGKDLYVWATNGAPWAKLEDNVLRAGLEKKQVEVAWIKLSDTKPKGEFPRNARDYQDRLKSVVLRLKNEYPNVKIVYLSSRIYGGYDMTDWNPEPYAYESAFGVRWLINDQVNGNVALNYNPSKGTVRAPIMLWGPYMWANGEDKRSDGLTWERADFSDDGTTPTKSGLEKTTKLLMDYFKYNELASRWFLKEQDI